MRIKMKTFKAGDTFWYAERCKIIDNNIVRGDSFLVRVIEEHTNGLKCFDPESKKLISGQDKLYDVRKIDRIPRAIFVCYSSQLFSSEIEMTYFIIDDGRKAHMEILKRIDNQNLEAQKELKEKIISEYLREHNVSRAYIEGRPFWQ